MSELPKFCSECHQRLPVSGYRELSAEMRKLLRDKNRLSAENERQKHINATHLEEHQRLVAENSRLKGVLAELTNTLGLDAPVSTGQDCTQNGNDDRGSEQYANPEHCHHLGDTWTAGGQTYCDDCGVELL